MCGIFGVIFRDTEAQPSETRLAESARLLAHRGPDGTGIFAGAGIGLAHTRLSLVDLDERSNQPFWDATQRYCIVFNGEIYNFRELREELEHLGVRFRTTSDTEVVLEYFVHAGAEAALQKLHGMFALAVHDTHEQRTYIARDRFGIKPLLLQCDELQLTFASEAKAIRPWFELQPNSFQLIRFLMGYGVPVRGEGLFAGIEMLPPGTLVTVDAGCAPQYSTFSELPGLLNADTAQALEAMGPEQVVDHVDDLLQQSVKRMLFADAPVGAFCSGGVDSSLLMAIAARFHNNLAIFHADVVGRESEYAAAAALANHLKLDMLKVEVRDDDFLEQTAQVMYHYEFPFSGHPHSVPFLMVSKLVQTTNVKAVLTGEGSDENFLGYNHLPYEPWWRFYQRQLERLRHLAGRVPVIGEHLWPTQAANSDLIADMLTQGSSTAHERRAREVFASTFGAAGGKGTSAIRSLELLGYHLGTLLHRNDTMGMSASIEARFPFLDEALVETAVNLPYRYKVRFSPRAWEREHPLLRDKWVIRAVADRYMPKHLSKRKKWGFDVSAYRRMSIDKSFFAGSFVADFLRMSSARFDTYLDELSPALKVKFMMLEMWGQMFIRGDDVDTARASLRRYAIVGARP